MNKKLIILLILIISLIFTSCDSTDITIVSSNTDDYNNSIYSSTQLSSLEYEYYNIYQITNDEDEFNKIILQNDIDENYRVESYETATTQEIIDIEKKYIDIWKSEMEYSIENLLKILDVEDTESFNDCQKQWENGIINNLKLEKSILSDSDKYDVTLGSSFNPMWLFQVREEYRQRTIRIKYLNYLLETQNSNPKTFDECLSLNFKN